MKTYLNPRVAHLGWASLALTFWIVTQAVSVFGMVRPLAPQEAVEAKLAAPKLQVYPPAIQLTTSRDHQTLVAQVELPSGLTEDVTSQIQFIFEPAGLVEVQGNRLTPKQNGAGLVRVRWADQQVELPLSGRDLAAQLSTGCDAGIHAERLQ